MTADDVLEMLRRMSVEAAGYREIVMCATSRTFAKKEDADNSAISEVAAVYAERDALLSALKMGAELNTPDFMDWIAARLVNVHGENPNVDYVVSLRRRAQACREAIARSKGGDPLTNLEHRS